MLGDHAKFQQVMVTLQQSVAKHDPAAVASLIAYPLRATLHGRKTLIRTPQAFVKNYDGIVTPAIAAVIQRQKYEDLFVNAQGAMFGSGEVWITGICRDKACKQNDIKIQTIQSTRK